MPGCDGAPKAVRSRSPHQTTRATSTTCCARGRLVMSNATGFTIKNTPPQNDDSERTPQREKIIDAVQAAGAMFWRDPDGHAFAAVPCDIKDPGGAIMHLRVRGRRFALICRRLYGAANWVNGPRGARP